MIQHRTTLSRGYQITLPSKIRKAFDLKVDDPLEITYNNNKITITKAQPLSEQIDEMIKGFDQINEEYEKRLTPEQREFNKKTAGWTINQYHEYFDNLPETKVYIKEKYGI